MATDEKPFDLDAFESDTKRKDFQFTFGGEAYTLPAHPNLLAVLDLDNNRIEKGLRRLLGGDQWARMEASDAVLDTDRFNALMEAYQKHLGVPMGELSASPASSRKTAGRSKRISNGTTVVR